MPSIFSRSKTSSRPTPLALDHTNITAINEFGQYADNHSRSNSRQGIAPPTTLQQQQRPRTAPHASDERDSDRDLPELPHPYFLELRFPTVQHTDADRAVEYGYMSEGRQVTLGLQTVKALVDVVGKELESKGLTTPLLFSTRALDLSAHRVRALIRAFLRTVGRTTPDPDSDRRWRDEVRFSGPHELAAFLRWGLARIVRMQDGVELRGLADVHVYEEWRADEAKGGYAADHFRTFPPRLLPQVQPLTAALFPLLSRFAANASYSGLTPTALAALFGPLLFGLGAPSQPFTATYNAYLIASHATEHLILSYIRLQGHELLSKPAAPALPSRLKDWVRGYPSMLPSSKEAMSKPRAGTKLVRIISVRRNVRSYSRDLIRSASTWALDSSERDAVKDWGRVVGPSKGGEPRFSETYRKKLDLAPTVVPMSAYNREDGAGFGTLALPDVEKFRSLTELRWGMFETTGFDAPDMKKLEFDLNESARKYRPSKRDTIAWSDFANSGFTRDDIALDLSGPFNDTIDTWPDQQAELHRKLRKQQKALPSFGWSTDPVPGRDKMIEESFLDCWADLLLSTGWMEREEQTFRDCNWVLIDYKAAPSTATSPRSSSAISLSGTDNRTTSQWYVFEEFVPREYRDSLVNPKKKRNMGIFSSKSKKQPTTNNGRPYTGGGPRSPAREAEFERLLASDPSGSMAPMKLSPTAPPSPPPKPPAARPNISAPLYTTPREPDQRLKKPPFPVHPTQHGSAISRLKHVGRHSPRLTPSEETAVDYELADASGGSGESDGPVDESSARKKQRRHEPWVDIRLAGQNYEGRGRAEHSRTEQVEQVRAPTRSPAPAAAIPRVAPPLAPSPGPDEGMEPVHFAEEPPASPVSQRSELHPGEPDHSPGTPLDELGRPEFPLPPGASLPFPMQDAVFGSAPRRSVSSPEGDTLEDEDQGDFEPMEESAEGGEEETEHTEQPDEEDVDDGATDASGPDHATPFDPNSPGGIHMAQWQTQNAAKHGSGVSSLIELYQDRDRAARGSEGLDLPSRIPLPISPKGSPVAGASPPLAVPSDLATGLGPVVAPLTPSQIPRYVHGAPLHNLLEEEDEE